VAVLAKLLAVVELVVLEVLDQMGTLTVAAKAAAQGMSIMLADEAAQVHLAAVATVHIIVLTAILEEDTAAAVGEHVVPLTLAARDRKVV
jgi:hypothetical protein